MKKWPKNNKAADFDELCKPVIKAVKEAYNLKRKEKDIKWTGLPIGQTEAAGCPEFSEALSAEGLAYHGERGREPIDVIISIAIQLGIEQGRRMTAEIYEKEIKYMKAMEEAWKK